MRLGSRRFLSLTVAGLLATTACAPASAPPPAPQAPAGGAPATSAPPAPSATAEPKPLIIGASISLTGSNARTGKEVNQGFELWQKDINAAGGLMGRKVEFKIYDDETKPETAAKLYERLITVDNVELIIGPYGSPVTAAASAVTEKYKFPMIASGASATDLWDRGFRYLFEVYTAETKYMDGAIELAAEKGAKTVAIVNENTNFAKGVAAGTAELAKKKGMTVVLQEQYTQNAKDFTPLIQKIKAANPDVLIGGTYLPDAVNLTRQAKDLDLNAMMMAFSVGPALPDYYKDLAKDAEYIYGSSQWEPSLKLPGVDTFVKKYMDAYGYEPGYHAAGGYGSGQLLEAAVKKAGSLDKEKLRDALQTLETTTVFGAYKVDEKGLQTAKPGYMTQWQNGKRAIVGPKDAATAPAMYPTPNWKDRK